METNLPKEYKMAGWTEPTELSFIEDTGKTAISIKIGENSVQLSEGDCISFRNRIGKTNKGKITAFGFTGGTNINRIYYKPWVHSGERWQWHTGMDSEIALSVEHYDRSSGDWRTITKISCPDVSQMGGRRKLRKRSRKTRRRQSRRRITRRK